MHRSAFTVAVVLCVDSAGVRLGLGLGLGLFRVRFKTYTFNQKY
jgi:hypothetical protein